MDPVSAVGLASSILTFVEFASNLVAGSVKIYRSVDGAVDEDNQLDKAIDELDSLSGLLDKRPICKTEAERKIARIAGDCRADSKKLEEILTNIANPKNKRAFWRSLRASWMTIMSRKDVAELKSRLQDYRSQVLLHVTLLLREEQSSLGIGIARIRDDCSQMKIGFRTDISSSKNEILDAISALDKPGGVDMSEASLASISKMLLAIQAKVDETQLHHRILRQLVFKDMNSRANQIHKAAQDTYTWVLQDGPVNKRDQRTHAWQIFLQWLRTGNNVLFVSGNPGSGKSTFMKFLIQHERTKEELAVWSGANTLIFGGFYFWNSGSPTQRTLSSLYRSLLFQSLSQQPQLMEQVFPLQLSRMRAFPGNTTVEEIKSFDEDQIEEAFNLLLERAPHGGYRLCFFIDGLDECEGKRREHKKLALKLQSWTVSGAIKLCVSSRPYSEFSEPLTIPKNRVIHLHELNESDIRAYCINKFDNDIQARERLELCRNLAAIVVQRAQGVFLWVYLVIDKLLDGLHQADPDYVLRAELQALPGDLDLLYTKLREPIQADSVQRDRSNRMLLLAAHNPCNRDLNAMAFSWLEEQSRDQGGLMGPDFPPRSEVKPYSEEEISKRIDRVTKQINGLARGFLEVRYTHFTEDFTEEKPSLFAPRVRFCHRTARDYLLHNENRHCDLLESFPGFEESSVYTRIYIAEISYSSSNIIPFYGIFQDFSTSFRNSIDPDLVHRFELAVRGSLLSRCRWLSSSTHPNLQGWHYGVDRASFIGFAAFRGLSRFVLREVTKDPTKLGGTSSCGSVLLAAVEGRQCRLTSELLRLSRGKNQLCEVWDEHNVQSTVPACVLATAQALEYILGTPHSEDGYSYRSRFREEDFILATELLRFSISLEISLRITVVGAKAEHGHFYEHDPEELQVQIDAAEAVTLFDRLRLPGEDIASSNAVVLVLCRLDGWRIMEEMRIGKLGRVVDEGADMTHRLKEWPDEPHAFFTGRIQDMDVYMDKIEWASENQELRELRGWVRLY